LPNLIVASSSSLSLGQVSTFAGSGKKGFVDGPRLTQATFDYPVGIAIDSKGNLFVSDTCRIRKISTEGLFPTVFLVLTRCSSVPVLCFVSALVFVFGILFRYRFYFRRW
jgi:hypothetical protein